MATHEKEAADGVEASFDTAHDNSETVLHNGNIIGKVLLDHEAISQGLIRNLFPR